MRLSVQRYWRSAADARGSVATDASVRLQRRVSQLTGTTGVDPLHVSGHILYTFEDAMEADECADGASEVRARAGVGRVDDDRAVRAPRRAATEGFNVAGSVQGRRKHRAKELSRAPRGCPHRT